MGYSRQNQKQAKRVMPDADKRRAAIELLFQKGDWELEEDTKELLRRLLTRFGLLCDPIRESGISAREIKKRAKEAEEKAKRKTSKAFWRKVSNEKLKEMIDAASRFVRMKVEALTYQVMRGDRIITRYPTPEDRKKSGYGRWPDHEITLFLQVAERAIYNRQGDDLINANSRIRLLATILLIAEGILEPSQGDVLEKVDTVRHRLKNASPLDKRDFDRYIFDECLVESKENMWRMQQWEHYLRVLNFEDIPKYEHDEAEKKLEELEKDLDQNPPKHDKDDPH